MLIWMFVTSWYRTFVCLQVALLNCFKVSFLVFKTSLDWLYGSHALYLHLPTCHHFPEVEQLVLKWHGMNSLCVVTIRKIRVIRTRECVKVKEKWIICKISGVTTRTRNEFIVYVDFFISPKYCCIIRIRQMENKPPVLLSLLVLSHGTRLFRASK